MLIAVTVMPIVFGMLKDVPDGTPAPAAPLSALVTLLVIIGIGLKATGMVRLWAPVIGVVTGSVVAGFFGLYDIGLVADASWIGLPKGAWPGFDLNFGPVFWALLPAFVFVTLIGAIEQSATPSPFSTYPGASPGRWISGRCRVPWPRTEWGTCCPVSRARCRIRPIPAVYL